MKVWWIPSTTLLSHRRIRRPMAEKLVQHRHCKWCDRAVQADARFCGKECEGPYYKAQRRKLNQYLILIIIAGAIIALTLFLG